MQFYKKTYFLLFVICSLALTLRIYKLDSYGLNYDEQTSLSGSVGIPYASLTQNLYEEGWEGLGIYEDSIFSSQQFWKWNTVSNVIKMSSYDNGAVCYNLFTHFWVNLFGTSDFSIRFISVLFNILTIVLSFFLAKYLFQSDRVGLITAFLLAIHPLFIYTSQFARAHSMATFFSLLSFFFLLKIIRNSSILSYYIGYILVTIIAVLSHLLNIPILLSHIIIMLWIIREKVIWLKYLLSGFIVLIIYILWLPLGGFESFKIMSIVSSKYSAFSADWREGDNPYFMPATILNISKGWAQSLLIIFGNSFQDLGFRIKKIILLIIIPVFFLFIGYYHSKNLQIRQNLFLLIIVIFTTLILRTIASLHSNFIIYLQSCYGVFIIPYAILFIGYGVAQVPNIKSNWKKTGILFVCVQIIIMLLSLIPHYSDNSSKINTGSVREKNIYNAIANKIKDNYQQNEIITFRNYEDAQLTNLYLKDRPDILQRIDTTITHSPKVANEN